MATARKKNTRHRAHIFLSKLDSWLSALPFNPLHTRRALAALLAAFALLLFLLVLNAYQVPSRLWQGYGNIMGHIGFKLKTITITGNKNLQTSYVKTIAQNQLGTPLPLLDLSQIRADIMDYNWVEDAHVSRKWPDMLNVEIRERTPAAIWQHNGLLALVDAGGHELVRLTPANAPAHFMLVLGENANKHMEGLSNLLNASPRLKAHVIEADWIGNRRWDVHFDTHELVVLPEDDAQAASAFTKMGEMDRTSPIFGKGHERIDIKDGKHMIIRMGANSNSTQNDLAPENAI
jgi:cell division protein FtsQ